MQLYKKARLTLSDGSVYEGVSFGYEASVSGEVVFHTGMTGYPESLTDPSYKGQILVSTYPMVGNYGVPHEKVVDGVSINFESDAIYCTALIVTDYSLVHSHWNAERSLSDWLIEQKVPALCGIDTRALTKKLRDQGTMLGKIEFGSECVQFTDPNSRNLVAEVSTRTVEHYGKGGKRIVVVDCGVKNSSLRTLMNWDVELVRVPWDYDFTAEQYDGLVVSNGPGDPATCGVLIKRLQQALKEDKPILGICLGNQLLARAAGASTYKLKYGHRGHNQPVERVGSQKCYITSQNHGFAVDGKSLPEGWEPLFLNLNDGTNEGIRHSEKPFYGVQFQIDVENPIVVEFMDKVMNK